MKVLRDGKEVKNAVVIYSGVVKGMPELVRIDGVNYDAKVFEFQDEETQTKKKEVKSDDVMTTKNTPRRRK